MGSALKKRTGPGHSAAKTYDGSADKAVKKHCFTSKVTEVMEER